jgi:hypothetical protein
LSRTDSHSAPSVALPLPSAFDEAGGQAEGEDPLERALGELPSLAPPEGWRAEVFEAIDREERASARRRMLYSIMPFAAAAIALLSWRRLSPAPQGAPVIGLEIVPGEVARGGAVALGDTLRARAQLTGAGELRVYRDEGEIVLRCPGDAGCREGREGGQRSLLGELRLAAPGRYDVVVVSGEGVPASAGRFADDLRAAQGSGAQITKEPPLNVR